MQSERPVESDRSGLAKPIDEGVHQMLLRKILVAGTGMAVCTAVFAQDYFDFGQIPGLPEKAAVEVDLNASMLAFARETARQSDPAAAELLSNIEGVQVRVYNTIENIDDVVEYIDEAEDRLAREDWQQVVRVQEEGDVRIFMRMNESAVTGFTAMIVDDGEAVFINVAGSITPAQLAQMANTVGMGDVMASLGEIPGVE
jgi:hypothetical protein